MDNLYHIDYYLLTSLLYFIVDEPYAARSLIQLIMFVRTHYFFIKN